MTGLKSREESEDEEVSKRPGMSDSESSDVDLSAASDNELFVVKLFGGDG